MSQSQWVQGAVRAAVNDKEHPKLSAVMLIIIGLFFTPWLIGIPILIFGCWKLCRSPSKATSKPR